MSESETQSPPTPPGPEPAAAKNPSAGATGDQPPGKATAGDGSAAVAPAGAALEEQLATAKKEAAGNYDHYLRALADLENFRRRAIREKEELRQFASVNLLQSLLPILDNLQLGLAAARQQTDTKTVVDGVAMVLEQLKGVLLHHGLKEVNPVGQKFDPICTSRFLIRQALTCPRSTCCRWCGSDIRCTGVCLSLIHISEPTRPY